ncbi:uncharacterized protein CTRU02_207687 [Colletotrichum truncatum]|uniref:Uncharacterized protein n=1 Tax=Colletotrichum truncatum TaxID=5467 RepID=A0ACC3Z1I0_COLTU|nr:uncharacterized protein CTRU02_09212 [Colletotrichum truncatum]KAF6788891.1 hypothetical protein CTRU02_09212 [Colletotrichum truncatum]
MLSRTRFSPDIAFPVGAPPINHFKRDIAARRPKQPNPRLCSRCQDWDIPEFAAGHGPKAHYYLPLSTISQGAKNCLICRAVSTAVESRRRECDWLRKSPEQSVYVAVQGPFFLDSGLMKDQKRRLNRSVEGEISVKMFLELTLSVVLDGTCSGDVAPLPLPLPLPPPFAVTPQFQMKYLEGDTPRLQAVDAWEAESFDVSTLKGWIDGCEMLHGKECVGQYRSISDLPYGFRVIDVHSMTIVQPVKPVRFVALSYMWEASEGAGHAQLINANASDLEVEGSLLAVTLPRIITDTISLCRDLGETYLWVDRLCIIQDDERSKPDQIEGMDRIYQSAAFSIMSALNDRKGRGLPGYADYHRMPRASLWGPPRNRNTWRGWRGIDPNGIETIVDASLWNRRGWTFQERLLSRRRLFITEYQVLFECCRGQATEELTWNYPKKSSQTPESQEKTSSEQVSTEHLEEDTDASASEQDANTSPEYAKKRRHIPSIPGFYRRPPHRKSATIRLANQVSLAHYCHWVEDYTSRQFSHSADVLNAFAGVGNAVKKAMRSEKVYGIPEVHLPQALMWSHIGAASRRQGVDWIPSWSWAAWMGTASYQWIHGEAKLVDTKLVRIVTLVYFHLQDPKGVGGLRPMRVTERWMGTGMRLVKIPGPEKLPPMQRRMDGGKVRVSEEVNQRYAEMWRTCPHSPWEALAHTELKPEAVAIARDFPGALVFSTTVASLRIGRDWTNTGVRASGKEWAREDAEILDLMGRQVGYLDKMDVDWIAGRKGTRDRRKLLDFVVISAGLEVTITDRNEWAFIEGQFHEMWRFNVLLVERLSFEPFVARRIGAGSVRVSRWKDCSPRWETVVLC